MHNYEGRDAHAATKTSDVRSLLARISAESDDMISTSTSAGAFPRVADYPTQSQFDIRVDGPFINKIAQDGDLLHCVTPDAAGAEPQDGDLVVIEYRDEASHRIMTRRMRQIGDFCEFRSESDDPALQNASMIWNMREDSGKFRILGKVLFAYRRLAA
jgi:hypothetical protein